MASPSRNYLLEMFAEFSRAVAAAQRYEDLRYRSASHGKIAPDDIPRRIFAEFYSVGEAVEARRPEFAGTSTQHREGFIPARHNACNGAVTSQTAHGNVSRRATAEAGAAAHIRPASL